MNIEKIYETLDLIAEKPHLNMSDVNMLLEISEISDSEVRAYVAELLVAAYGEEAEKKLINMCNDADEMVRTNACDSLSAFPTIESYNQLVKCVLNDKSSVVKTYAILSLADIITQIRMDEKELKGLFAKFSRDKKISISAACFRGLYILGEKKYLKKLIELLSTENYQDRCMIANILGGVLNDENKNSIIFELEKIKETEKSEAVRSTIDSVINESN